jgi:4-amino-4-deoxy-L-arabinose transferase-like glycosyltransferase
MHAPGQAERLWARRLRWRMRGAWQWPAFALLTVVDGILLTELPFYARGAGNLAGGILLAGFANILIVAVVAPLLGRRLRRRRPDLPRLVASDYAGAAALGSLTLLFMLGGILHRPAVAADARKDAAVGRAARAYVLSQAPGYRSGIASMDAIQLEADLYRACVPGPDPDRALCMFVRTGQSPPGVTRDTDETSNAAYRLHSGLR